MADDRRRETVAVIKRFRFCHRIMLREHPTNVTAPLGGISIFDFHRAAPAIAEGRAAVEWMMPAIRALLDIE
jgi:hypothetical protein